MLPILRILETVGATRSDIENWQNRLELQTEFQATIPGRARLYGPENVLELALIAAFVKAGVEPRSAVALAASSMRQRKSSVGVREWVVWFGGSSKKGVQLNEVSFQDLQSRMLESDRPPVITAVCAGEVVRRVDALFQY